MNTTKLTSKTASAPETRISIERLAISDAAAEEIKRRINEAWENGKSYAEEIKLNKVTAQRDELLARVDAIKIQYNKELSYSLKVRNRLRKERDELQRKLEQRDKDYLGCFEIREQYKAALNDISARALFCVTRNPQDHQMDYVRQQANNAITKADQH